MWFETRTHPNLLVQTFFIVHPGYPTDQLVVVSPVMPSRVLSVL